MKKIILIAILIPVLFSSACKDSSSPTAPNPIDSIGLTNQRPRITNLTGPTNCKLGQTYIYKAKGYDPDGEQVAFHFNVYRKGNQTPIDLGWGPYVDNYEEYEKSIAWNYGIGEFYICAHCKDKDGYQTLQQGHMTLDIYVTE
jgi:hypothetical protein